jgi:hypothetical protein
VILSHYAPNAAHAGVSAAGDDAGYAAAAHSAEEVDDIVTKREVGSIHFRQLIRQPGFPRRNSRVEIQTNSCAIVGSWQREQS